MSNFCPHCGKPLNGAGRRNDAAPQGHVVVEGKVIRESEKAVLLEWFPPPYLKPRQEWVARKQIQGEVKVGSEWISVAAWLVAVKKLKAKDAA